ncbi:MAG: hypothetical protein WB586_28645 [Chthoniobacterales bacterium]
MNLLSKLAQFLKSLDRSALSNAPDGPGGRPTKWGEMRPNPSSVKNEVSGQKDFCNPGALFREQFMTPEGCSNAPCGSAGYGNGLSGIANEAAAQKGYGGTFHVARPNERPTLRYPNFAAGNPETSKEQAFRTWKDLDKAAVATISFLSLMARARVPVCVSGESPERAGSLIGPSMKQTGACSALT